MEDSVILDPGSNIDFYIIEKKLWFCLSWSGIKYWFGLDQRKYYASFTFDPGSNIDTDFITKILWFCLSWSGIKFWFGFDREYIVMLSPDPGSNIKPF